MELTGEQLKKAELMLKSYLPQSLPVYGSLVQMNKRHLNQPRPEKVLVDKWPEFSFIIFTVNEGSSGAAFVFAQDAVVLEEAIRKHSFINWSNHLIIDTDLHHMDIFKRVGLEKNLRSHTRALCHVMMLEDVSHLPSIDSSGISLSSLDESHIALVNQTWKFSDDKTAEMISNMITRFPSLCILDEEGNPVSWILVYTTCAIGMLYTLPEHRGKGYAKVLIAAMAKRLHAEGCPVYCFIEEENAISCRLFKRMGFVEDPSLRTTWCEFNYV